MLEPDRSRAAQLRAGTWDGEVAARLWDLDGERDDRLPPIDGVVVAFRDREGPLVETQHLVHRLSGQDPLVLLPGLRREGAGSGVTDKALKIMETGYLRTLYDEKEMQATLLRNAGFSAFCEVPFPSFSYGIDSPRWGIISRQQAALRLMDRFEAASV